MAEISAKDVKALRDATGSGTAKVAVRGPPGARWVTFRVSSTLPPSTATTCACRQRHTTSGGPDAISTATRSPGRTLIRLCTAAA